MVDFDQTISFLVIDDLFDRYTIVVNSTWGSTSVYCEECDVWVNRYDDNKLTEMMYNDFYELIVADHDHQVNGIPVSFEDTESLL